MGDFVHWLVCNIPAGVSEIQKGQRPAGTELRNGFGRPGYGGPCPPSGTHRYFFTVYALDTERLDGASSQNFLEKVGEHMMGKAELVGLYSRKR